jgi:sRNA-binding protein
MKRTSRAKPKRRVNSDPAQATKGASVQVSIGRYLYPATVVSITGDEVTIKVTVPKIVRSMMAKELQSNDQ